MRIMNQLPEYDVSCDCSTNPELLLMAAEQDEDTYGSAESQWLAGQAVTTPKHSNYDN